MYELQAIGMYITATLVCDECVCYRPIPFKAILVFSFLISCM